MKGNSTGRSAVQADRGNVIELFPAKDSAKTDDSRLRPETVHPLRRTELGMATAEYAIATLAAVGFAGLLVVIMRSDEVRGFLLGIIRSALSIG